MHRLQREQQKCQTCIKLSLFLFPSLSGQGTIFSWGNIVKALMNHDSRRNKRTLSAPSLVRWRENYTWWTFRSTLSLLSDPSVFKDFMEQRFSLTRILGKWLGDFKSYTKIDTRQSHVFGILCWDAPKDWPCAYHVY